MVFNFLREDIMESFGGYRNTIYIAVCAQKRFWNGQPTELNFG